MDPLVRRNRSWSRRSLALGALLLAGLLAPPGLASTATYAFEMAPTSSPFKDAAPGQQVVLQFRIRNSGTADDTYTFTTIEDGPHRLDVTTPGPLDVPAGGSATTSFVLNVSDAAASAMPRVFATSTGDPELRRQLSWSVRVPVRIDVMLDDPSPTLREGTAPFGPRGVLYFTWADGTPAAHLPFAAVHTWMDLAPLAERHEGDTGADGRWFFDGLTFRGSGQPGEHTLLVTAAHAGARHSAAFEWEVQPA